jgi:hypothetical protein
MRRLQALFLALIMLCAPAIEAQGTIMGTNHRKVFTASGGSAAFVQAKDLFASGVLTTQVVTLNANVTAGSSNTMMITWETVASSILTVVDGNAASYANVAWASGATTCNSATGDALLYTLPNNAGGTLSKTITITWSGNAGFVFVTDEETSGVPSSSAIRSADCLLSVSTSAPVSPAVTPLANDFLVGFVADINANGRVYTAGTPPAYILDGTGTPTNTTQNEEHFGPATNVSTTASFATSAVIQGRTAIVDYEP